MQTRILCLNLEKLHAQTWLEPSCAEVFLSLSPRVQFREPHFIFIDVASTTKFWRNDREILKKSLELVRKMGGVGAAAALADNAYVAQALAAHDLSHPQAQPPVSPIGQDHQTLASLPLSALKHLEGLQPWSRPQQLEHIAGFFENVGIHRIAEILSFPLLSFRERWGVTGETLWRRLHASEKQVISPLVPTDPLRTYGYFDHPIATSDLLLAELHHALAFLFLRLSGLGRFARRVELILHCEYSKHRHQIVIEPVAPGRDQRLFTDLLRYKFDTLDLENPVREYELQVFDVPEKILQLDFFESRDTTEDHWKRLISLMQQAGVQIGFLEPLPKHFPEESFHLKSDWPEVFKTEDRIEKTDEAIQVKAVYAKNLLHSPRPSLLLDRPQPISRSRLRQFRKMSFFPAERMQRGWAENRDYYFALEKNAGLTWIFQNRESKEYFLHGYFD